MSEDIFPNPFYTLASSGRSRRRERAVFYLLGIRAGIWASEAMRLTWGQIDLAGRWLTLRASGTKSKRADVLPIADDLAGFLAAHRPVDATPSTKVFRHGKPRPRTFRADLARAMVKESTDDGVARLKSLRPTLLDLHASVDLLCIHPATKDGPNQASHGDRHRPGLSQKGAA